MRFHVQNLLFGQLKGSRLRLNQSSLKSVTVTLSVVATAKLAYEIESRRYTRQFAVYSMSIAHLDAEI